MFAASEQVLRHREHRQVQSLHRWNGTIRFFRTHPRLARSRVGHRELRRARVWVRVIRRELADTRDALKVSLNHSRFQVPGWWLAQAACIRSHEGAWTSNTGNGYFGAYQFLLSTWASVGGRGLPSDASPDEQTFRAHLVWLRDGGSWSEWGTRGLCGV